MTGVGHLVTGGAVSLAFLSKTGDLSPLQLSGAFITGLVASIFPDIDADNSVLQVFIDYKRPKISDTLFSWRERRRFPGSILYTFVSTVEIAIRVLLKASVEILKSFSKHRGIVHTLTAAVAISVFMVIISALLGINFIYADIFLAGYITHLLADAMTISGVRLFSPFYKKSIFLLPKNLRIKVGRSMSLNEIVVVAIVVLVSAVFVVIN